MQGNTLEYVILVILMFSFIAFSKKKTTFAPAKITTI